jgi:hypothetical protein
VNSIKESEAENKKCYCLDLIPGLKSKLLRPSTVPIASVKDVFSSWGGDERICYIK